jgi:VCBS repeat-containing protein
MGRIQTGLYLRGSTALRGITAIMAAVALFTACNSGTGGPSITFNGESLQINSKVGKTNAGSFSFENTGSSSLNYSIAIPAADTWLELTPKSGTLAAKGKQSIEASATCPNLVTDLESKLSIAVTSGNTTITKTFTVKLKCEALDVTPDDFSFADVIGAEIDSDVTSAAITITGIDAGTPVSASNGAVVMVNGSTANTISNNDKLSIRLRSSKLFDTSASTTVTVGTVSKSFAVTTRKEPKLSLNLIPAVLSVMKGGNGQTVAQITRENFDKAVVVTAQNLPAGVSVNDLSIAAGSSTGNLSFTVANSAMVGGPFDVLVSASGDGKTVTQTLKLTITGASSDAVTIGGYVNISSLVNTAITPQTPMIMGGATPYTISIAPALPTGLSINAATGEISGTATVAQALTKHTVMVADANSKTASTTLDVTITAALGIAKPYGMVQGTIGYPIKFPGQAVIEGGTKPYNFSISPTTLPTGVSFNAATGMISGTPTVSYAIKEHTVTVKDQDGLQLTLPVKVTVNAAPNFIKGYQSLMNQVGHNDNLPQTPEVSGGSLPLQFAVTPHLSEKTGLSFSASTGMLSGLPSIVANEEVYTVTALDLNDAPTTTKLRVHITPELAPKVLSSLPISQASGIDPKLKEIKLNFNEAVDVTIAGVSLKCNGINVPLTGLPATNSSVVVISWSNDLTKTASCVLSIAKDAVKDIDLADGPDGLEFDYFLAFTTTDDAPTVVATTPIDNAVGVTGDTKIKVKFSENVNLQAGAVTLQCPIGSPITLTGLPKSNVSEVELTPTTVIPDTGVLCTVTVLKDKLDDSDSIDPPSTLPNDYSWQFGVDAAPTVTMAMPAQDSTNGIATPIVVTFSEPISIDAGVASATCSLQNAPFTTSTPVVTAQLDSSNTILTVAPSPNWPEAANCSITVDKTKVHDLDNIDPPDLLANNFVRGFKTDASPNDIALTPATIAENQPSNTTVGTLSTVDPDIGQTHSYVFVSGSGDANNSSFTIIGNQLKANASFDFETKNSYTVRVKSTDSGVPPLSVEKQITIMVSNVNEAPVAVVDSYTINEDTALTVVAAGVLSNDTDIDGNNLTAVLVTGAGHGSLTLNANGSFTYTPSLNYNGSDSFTYKANDGSLDSNTVTANITINAVDDAPLAVADSATVLEDAAATIVNVPANDTDIDGGPKSVASVTSPANGTVVITGMGTGLSYQPNANYCNSQMGGSPDTFTYTLSPGGSSATVSMTVTCINDAPLAVADSATVLEDAAATSVNVLANDTDIDGDPKSIAAVTQPINGTVVITGMGTGLTYKPNANYCGPDSFMYTLNGGSSATVSMNVICVDEKPVAVADSYTVNEDTMLTVAAAGVLSNDSDVDGDSLTAVLVTNVGHGSLTLNANGSFTYTPSLNYNGSDSFTYKANDGAFDSNTVTVTITINAVDDAPVAVADSAIVLENAAATSVNVLANDTDIDGGPKSIDSVAQPANGTVVITGGGTGLTYQPKANYCGSDSFSYSLSPGSSSTTVSMTVTCAPPTVTSINDSDADNEVFVNTALTYTVTFSEDIDASTVTAADFNNSGTATITIGAPTETTATSGIFTFTVTPTSDGTIILRIPSGAVIKDMAGNNLVVPVIDNDTIAVIGWKSISAGFFHTCGITSDNKAYCWGRDTDGELGDDANLSSKNTPTLVAGGLTFTSISAGNGHTCAIARTGAAYCWGSDSAGQLGDDATIANKTTPALVAGGLTFTSISTGWWHTCAIASNGAAYCWGQDYLGKLGDDAALADKPTPTLVAGGLTFTSINTSWDHNCGIVSGGNAYCWGSDNYGQLGDDATLAYKPIPVLVAGGHTFTSIDAGGDHSCGTTSTATYCWGRDDKGQLGDDVTIADKSTPTLIATGYTFTSVNIGDFHSCGITSIGNAYCWGGDGAGELGNGIMLTTDQPTPTSVAGGLTFTSINGGNAYTCGITTNKQAYCWGYGGDGQIGNGVNISQPSPFPVSNP